MQEKPPVIPFLFFVAVIITLAGIAIYGGTRPKYVRANPTQTKHTADHLPLINTDILADLQKDPKAVEAFNAIAKEHQLLKIVHVPKSGYWIEIGGDKKEFKTNSSLWLVQEDGTIKKIFSGIAGECSDFTWKETGELETNNVVLYHSVSPCEGGTSHDIHEYTLDGLEVFTLEYSSPGNTFDLTSYQFAHEEMSVGLVFDTKCPETYVEGTPIPTVLLKNLRVNKKLIPLKQERIACSPWYENGLIEPDVSDITYTNSTLSFTLPNTQHVYIDTEKVFIDASAAASITD